MKVVFLQDVPNVAKAGEIKEVAAGYGRNFLIPRKLAALASPQAMSQLATIDKARTDKELTEIARQLEGKEVSLKAHVGARGRLYGSITSADIAAELERATGIAVDKRKIELAEPIRQLGNYELTIHLGKDITPKITVAVSEEVAPAKEEKKPPKKKAAAKAPEAEEKVPKKPAAKKAAAKKTAAKKETKAKKPAKKEAAPTKKATKAKTAKKKEEAA
jgi:large subunit ribosomal protein L9